MTPYDEDEYLEFDITHVDDDCEEADDTNVDGVLQELWDQSGTQDE